jgi:hypothetical protein
MREVSESRRDPASYIATKSWRWKSPAVYACWVAAAPVSDAISSSRGNSKVKSPPLNKQRIVSWINIMIFVILTKHAPPSNVSQIGTCARFECRSRGPLRSTQAAILVMPALVAGIHVFAGCVKPKTWMAGTSPAMTADYTR